MLFEMARDQKPSIIFIDEVDSICSKRDDSYVMPWEKRMKSQLLTEMEGGVGVDDQGVLILAATNIPWNLDPAFRLVDLEIK